MPQRTDARAQLAYPDELRTFVHQGIRFVRITPLHERGMYDVRIDRHPDHSIATVIRCGTNRHPWVVYRAGMANKPDGVIADARNLLHAAARIAAYCRRKRDQRRRRDAHA